MLLNGDDADNDYKTNNHGLMFTLTLGVDGVGGKSEDPMMGFQLEQDLGFINVRHKDGKWSEKKCFKGATLVGVNLHQNLPKLNFIFISPKIGVGAVYMKTPESAAKSIQSWFAVRPSIAINFSVVLCLSVSNSITLWDFPRRMYSTTAALPILSARN